MWMHRLTFYPQQHHQTVFRMAKTGIILYKLYDFEKAFDSIHKKVYGEYWEHSGFRSRLSIKSPVSNWNRPIRKACKVDWTHAPKRRHIHHQNRSALDP